jgi:hypothetical protein
VSLETNTHNFLSTGEEVDLKNLQKPGKDSVVIINKEIEFSFIQVGTTTLLILFLELISFPKNVNCKRYLGFFSLTMDEVTHDDVQLLSQRFSSCFGFTSPKKAGFAKTIE